MSEKTKDPILRKFSDGQTDRQTDRRTRVILWDVVRLTSSVRNIVSYKSFLTSLLNCFIYIPLVKNPREIKLGEFVRRIWKVIKIT